MKHYGDITKMNGGDIEPVWLITGGSPCQDLSVAGKRAGLAGERSGLFMEMIRIIKEMRAKDGMDRRADEFIRPRFVLWENVPGALSSNSGEDFRCVLEEFARVKDETVSIPRPPKGKWLNAGSIVGDGWSLAWRIRDAQYWGVPQRRRRIALLVDYSGLDAGTILFEQCIGRGRTREVRPFSESLCGDTGESEEAGQGVAEHPTGSHRGTAYTLKIRGGRGNRFLRKESGKGCADTKRPFGNTGSIAGSDTVYAVDVYNQEITGDVAATVTAASGGTNTSGPKVLVLNDQGGAVMHIHYGITEPLRAEMKHPNTLTEKRFFEWYEDNVSVNLRNRGGSYNGGSEVLVIEGNDMGKTRVRRLTPMECERLQSFPDNWTDIGEWTDSKGKKHKTADTSRYKALGNSIACCAWIDILQEIAERCPKDELTLGSLFDGIGGFPLIWTRLCGGKAVWASEIEEFCIAVTKRHFGENRKGE